MLSLMDDDEEDLAGLSSDISDVEKDAGSNRGKQKAIRNGRPGKGDSFSWLLSSQ